MLTGSQCGVVRINRLTLKFSSQEYEEKYVQESDDFNFYDFRQYGAVFPLFFLLKGLVVLYRGQVTSFIILTFIGLWVLLAYVLGLFRRKWINYLNCVNQILACLVITEIQNPINRKGLYGDFLFYLGYEVGTTFVKWTVKQRIWWWSSGTISLIRILSIIRQPVGWDIDNNRIIIVVLGTFIVCGQIYLDEVYERRRFLSVKYAKRFSEHICYFMDKLVPQIILVCGLDNENNFLVKFANEYTQKKFQIQTAHDAEQLLQNFKLPEDKEQMLSNSDFRLEDLGFIENQNIYIGLERAFLKLKEQESSSFTLNNCKYLSKYTNNSSSLLYTITVYVGIWESQSALYVFMRPKEDDQNEKNAIADTICKNASRDIKMNLMNIQSLSEQALAKFSNDTLSQSIINNIYTSTQQVTYKLNDSLDFNELRKGQLQLNLNEFNLEDKINEAVSVIEQLAKEKSLELQIDIDKQLPINSLYSDPDRFIQILVNLLFNALKYTKAGFIKVKAKTVPNNSSLMEISVSDSGEGIPDNIIPTLFKKTVELSKKQNSKRKMGIGLTICKGLVGMLGPDNEIQVFSKPGRGSKFSFVIYITKEDFSNNNIIEINQSLKAMKKQISEYQQNDLYDDEIVINVKKGQYYNNVNGSQDGQSPQQRDGNNNNSVKMSFIDNLASEIPQDSGLKKDLIYDPNIERGDSNSVDKQKNKYETIRNSSFQSEKKNIQKENANEYIYILIVDDNQFQAKVVQNYFVDKTNVCVVLAENGKEAVDAVDNRIVSGKPQFSLIFMDLAMPVMDGFTATKLLKDKMKKNEIPNVPIVALTALTSKEDIDKCNTCGFDYFLAKPASQKIILDAYDKIVKE